MLESPQRALQGARAVASAALVAALASSGCAPAPDQEVTALAMPRLGLWNATLTSPGGELAFGVEIVNQPSGGVLLEEEGLLQAVIVNGKERRPAGTVQVENGGFAVEVPPYRSRLILGWEGSNTLTGHWERDRGKGMQEVLSLALRRGDAAKRPPLPAPEFDFGGRWRVDFGDDDHDAVGIFTVAENGKASGTFLTTLGDYRYLAGHAAGNTLTLSCFDGAHAFLFKAQAAADGTLTGDFWSRDSYHDTWTATRDEAADLPDDFALTEWVGGVPLADVRYPDVDGKDRSLADPAFDGKARLLVVFGTWCPNCNDLTEFLVELEGRYEDLSIVGLAFELGDDPEAHRTAVRDYLAHHKADYPVLVGGIADKKAASEAFPLIDRVRAYPTTVFMDGTGNVTAVHTGFSGPATGDRHLRLRERFESEIETLLGGD